VRTSDIVFVCAIASGALAMIVLDSIQRWLRSNAPDAARDAAGYPF